MKSIIKIVTLSVASGIGFQLGYWLWDNILEDKADDMYEKHQKKKLKSYSCK